MECPSITYPQHSEVLPLSFLNVIIIGTAFSYLVKEILKKISLFQCSPSDKSCGSDLDDFILALN